MNDITFTILKVVVSMSAVLITIYVVPYVQTLKNNKRYENLLELIDIAVRAAEQTIRGSGKGTAKKEEVMQTVNGWLNDNFFEITQAQLSQLVEAAVYSMNAAKEGAA